MHDYKYVIVGGGLAGGTAVDGIRERDADGSLALVTQELHRPYQRPPLSKGYLTGTKGLDKVYLQPEEHYARSDVEVVTGVRAVELRPESRMVVLEDGRSLAYGTLLLATGGQPRRLPMPGNELGGVFTLRTIDDSEGIQAAAGGGKPALILGGSFIGSEVAASVAQLGSRVTIAFPESRLLERIVPQELSEYLHRMYAEHGVRVLPGTTAQRLEGDGRVQRAILSHGESLGVDLVVMGAGIRLSTELARQAGLEVQEPGGAVVVDEMLRSRNPDIYAAGDIAAWPDPTFHRRLRVEHWDVARQQGERAGYNMAGDREPYTALPYFFSDLFDLSFEVWGDLSRWERTVRRGSVEEGSFAYYYFDEDRLTGVLAVERPDGEREPMQLLVKARPGYEEIADGLRSNNVDLAELADASTRR